MVVDSGAFVSATPAKMHEEYPLIPLGATATGGGRMATGQEVPILGERRLQVSLMETQRDLLMSFKVIEGIQRPLGSVTELVRNHCKVIFHNENEGGSYIYNRRRDEYYKIYARNLIFVVPVKFYTVHAKLNNN